MKHLLLFSLATLVPFCGTASTGHTDHDHQEHGGSFIENLGQWPAPVRFRADVNGGALFLENNGWAWSKLEASAADRMHDFATLTAEEQRTLQFNGHAWRMRFVGGAGEAPKGLDKAAFYHNYFLGNDSRSWKGHVGVFGKVHQASVWPGIDVALSLVGGNFKYDVLIAPGANEKLVALAYDGLMGMSINEAGELLMKTSVGDVTELAPVAFYGDEIGGPIACRFVLEGSTVRFAFPNGFDKNRPVVIDPVLVAGTYSGATGASNYGHCAAYDDQGHIYSAGRNFGPTYPATVGAFQTSMGGGGTDISLSKYNPDGSELIWAAYLGGSNGENPHSLIANSLSELVVLASTSSTNFPITDGAFDGTLADQDIAVVHIAADGSSLIGSTFVGGSGSDGTNSMGGNYGEAYRGEVYTDAVNNILVASFSSSADFPTTSGAFQSMHGGGQDGVVFKLDPSCSNVLASSYLGGSSDDNAMGIRVAENGEIFVTGASASSDFPMTSGGFQTSFQGGARDGYIVRLSADLTSMVNGSFFGTTGSDRPYFLDTDSEDRVWIYGQTDGEVGVFPEGTFGSTGNGNLFLAKFLSDLSDAPVTTMIPGSAVPVAFLVDVCDHVYISGYNSNGALPTTPDALYTTGSFYLASFDVDLTGILFGTYYGGSHVDGGTSRFDKNGVVYQGVCSGGQSMQSTSWAFAPNNQIAWDIAVFKIDFETAGVQANITSNALTGCVPATFELNATGQAVEFTWDLGDGSPLQTGQQITVSYDQIGAYVITLIGSDPGACNLADTTYITLNVYDPNELLAAFEATPQSTCDGYFLQLENNSVGATQYSWDFGDNTTSNAAAPTHEYAGPGTYTVYLEALNTFCVDSTDVSVPVTFTVPSIPFELASPAFMCPGGTVQVSAGAGYDTYLWSTNAQVPAITVSTPGVYTVVVTDGFCVAQDSVDVLLVPSPEPLPDQVICPRGELSLVPGVPVTEILWSTGSSTTAIQVEETGTYSFVAVDEQGCTFRDTVEVMRLPDATLPGFIPNVFTPNGDNKNDRFQVDGEGLLDFRMQVYDRWGLKMFETTRISNGWNGGLDNATAAAVPEGTYYYIIDFRDRCADDQATTKTGHVTLLR